MAKSHPALLYDHAVPRSTFWARNTLSSIALLVSIASLAIMFNAPATTRLAGLLAQSLGALELPQLPLNRFQTQPVEVDPNEAKYRAIGEHLARRFRVSADMTTHVVAKAHDVGRQLKLDPMLILAVIAVESRFNPVAESVMGAKGLMQVIPRFHPEKFGPLGGEQVAFETTANITVGAKILKEYIGRTGDLGDALQLYVGASSEENENGYSGKVMAERERLNGVLRQYQSRAGATQLQAQAKPLPSAI
jgi:soluble lytic murein transglycosylase-like protein